MLIERGKNRKKEEVVDINDTIDILKELYDKTLVLNKDKSIMTPRLLLFEVEQVNKIILSKVPPILTLLNDIKESQEEDDEEEDWAHLHSYKKYDTF